MGNKDKPIEVRTKRLTTRPEINFIIEDLDTIIYKRPKFQFKAPISVKTFFYLISAPPHFNSGDLGLDYMA